MAFFFYSPVSNPTQRITFRVGYPAGEGPQKQRNSEVERFGERRRL